MLIENSKSNHLGAHGTFKVSNGRSMKESGSGKRQIEGRASLRSRRASSGSAALFYRVNPMYIYMCVCICICIYIYVCIYVYIYIYIKINTYAGLTVLAV